MLRALLITSVLLLRMPMAEASSASDPVLEAYTAAIASTLGSDVAEALHAIEGTHRKLLAARSYLRVGDKRIQRWSWNAAEISAFEGSDAHRAFVAAVEKVRVEFARQNPGFSLYANTQVRSLDVQIARWNENRTVAQAAKKLLNDAQLQLTAEAYPQRPDRAARTRFSQFLVRWTPNVSVPLAAPGLSLHGRARAVDFQVQSGKRVIAAAETASVAGVWDGLGWTEKLQRAVQASGARFAGPLRAPHEPWHYEYEP